MLSTSVNGKVFDSSCKVKVSHGHRELRAVIHWTRLTRDRRDIVVSEILYMLVT